MLANTAAQVRVQVMGDVKLIVVLLSSVLEAMGSDGKTATLDDVISFTRKLTGDHALFSKVKGWYMCLNPGDVAFLPQGSVVCEKVSSGALVYGVRKSFLINSPASISQYRASIELLNHSKRDTSRMQQIAGLFKK